jgi:uncharacterized membrane protein
VIIFPANAVQRLDVSTTDLMAFIVSGGVTEIKRAAEAGVTVAKGA